MTEALYHTDDYLKEFEAVITAVDGNRVAFDRTAFYPGGGGQPNDAARSSCGQQYQPCGQTWPCGQSWPLPA